MLEGSIALTLSGATEFKKIGVCLPDLIICIDDILNN